MRIPVLVVMIVCTSCAGARSARWFDAADLQPVQDPDAPAVVLRAQLRVTSNARTRNFSSTELEGHAATQILTGAGVGLASLHLRLSEDEEVEDLRARSIDPDGTIRELQPSEIHDETGDAEVLEKATSVRELSWRVPGVKVGSIVEWAYRKVTKGKWWPGEDLAVSLGRIPIKRLDLEVLVSDRLRCAFRTYNSAVPIQMTKEGDMTRLSWTLRDLPGREKDDYSPDPTLEMPWLAFRVTEYVFRGQAEDITKNWSDVFRSLANKLAVDAVVFDGEPAKSSCGDDGRCKIEAAVADVRQVPLDRRAWSLRDARRVSKIRKSGHASPLDKEVLLLDALRKSGLEARPAALQTPLSRLDDPDFPMHQRYNHLAVYVPQQKGLPHAVWIDPGCEECKAGQLSEALAGTEAWVVEAQLHYASKSEVKVERLHPEGDSPPPDLIEQTTDMQVDASGTLTATRAVESRGAQASIVHLQRREWAESDWKKLGKEVAGWISATAAMQGQPTWSCDVPGGVCKSTMQFQAPAYAPLVGDSIVVPLVATTNKMDGIFAEKNRQGGIVFKSPETMRVVARVRVPAGHRLLALPERVEKSAPGLTAVVEARTEGDQVVVTRTLTFRPGLYGADTYKAHREVARTFADARDLTLTFVKAN